MPSASLPLPPISSLSSSSPSSYTAPVAPLPEAKHVSSSSSTTSGRRREKRGWRGCPVDGCGADAYRLGISMGYDSPRLVCHYLCNRQHFYDVDATNLIVDRTPEDKMSVQLLVSLCWRPKPSISVSNSSVLSGSSYSRTRGPTSYIACNFAQCPKATHAVTMYFNAQQFNIYNYDLPLGDHSFESFCCLCNKFRPDWIGFVDRNHTNEAPRPLNVDYRAECSRSSHRCCTGAVGVTYPPSFT